MPNGFGLRAVASIGTRALSALSVVSLAMTIGLTDGVRAAEVAAPTLAVSPNTNLAPAQEVIVTGTGLPLGTGNGTAGLLLVECQAEATDLSQCGANTAQPAFPDGSGNLSTPYVVQRTLARPFDTLRCDDAPQTCAVFLVNQLGLQGLAFVVSAPVSFDPSIPRPMPTLSVTPSTGLRDGQVVSVQGTGWNTQDEVLLAECSDGGTCSSGPAPVTVAPDADGTFVTPFTVQLRAFDANQRPTNCVAVSCGLHADDLLDVEYSAVSSIGFDPQQLLPPTPKVVVTPATGLHHGQPVTVSGSGFDAGGYADVSECPPGAFGACTDSIGSVPLINPDGTFTTTVAVSRLATSVGLNSGDPTSMLQPIDCITGGCTISVNESTNEEFGLTAAAPIEFDPTDPPPTRPHVAAAPLSNLAYRAVVTIRGTGFAPGEQVVTESCIESPGSGVCRGFATSVADSSGAVTIDVGVRRRAKIDNAVLDCVDPAVRCSVSLKGRQGFERFSFALAFDPNAPIPAPASITVTPHDHLGYRQTVHVFGNGFSPNTDLNMAECVVLASPEGSFSACSNSQTVRSDAHGHFGTSFAAQRTLGRGSGSGIDCAVQSGPTACTLSVNEDTGFFGADPLGTATQVLTFRSDHGATAAGGASAGEQPRGVADPTHRVVRDLLRALRADGE